MGLFWKKQSPEELFEKAKNQYEKGRYTGAALTYLKLKGEYLHEGEYRAALCYLADHDRKNRSGKPGPAITYLTSAARGGHREAALLLAERFGVRDYLPPETSAGGPELKFKARTKNPQGKPRVYFACHPDDFKAYFEELSDEVLKYSDCAVFYFEPDAQVTPDEDFYLKLGQMQLFVMPVTSTLLFQNSRAMDTEFSFAAEHHIPILPVMYESGLEKQFGARCGDLQYLDKASRDVTAIPYEEKLQSFLRSVLIGGELAAKVRAAFDAYIFLSYRKKDRKYAQQLMRLIHKNEICRDLAIWYDEFLTPGENFNDAIEEALRKSSLFALAVTPNLVNEDNYVASVEYPMAKQSQKPILPLVLVPTDQAALSQKYEDIPACTDAHDEQALSAAMLSALRDLAIRENDADPQHNFFIGLAYLGGIDVEVDHQRALSLITGAADAGLTEAMEKLAQMYHNGEGVARDYLQEVQWLEKLCGQARERWEAQKDRDSATEYLGRLEYLGSAWYELQRIPKAKECFLLGLELSRQLAQEQNTHQARRNLALIYSRLGAASRAEGKLDEARDHYTRAIGIDTELLAETNIVGDMHSLSIGLMNLGDIDFDEDKLSEAAEHYQKALEFGLRMLDTLDAAWIRKCVSISYSRMGNVREAEGNLEDAEACYEKALEIDRQLAQDTGENRRGVMVDLHKLGSIGRSGGDLDKAEIYYSEALKLSRQLAEDLGTLQSRRDLAMACSKMGEISQELKRPDQAGNYFRQALELDRQLAQETGTIADRQNLASGYSRLAGLSKAKGAVKEAKEACLAGFAIREELERETGTAESRRDLARSCDELGELCRKEGDNDKAKEYFSKGLALREALVGEAATVRNREELAVTSYFLARVTQDRPLLEKSRDIWAQLVEECPGVVRYAMNLDSVNREAARWDLLKLDLLKEFLPKEPEGSAEKYERMGDFNSVGAHRDMAVAWENYKKALALREQAANERGGVEDRRMLRNLYAKLGKVCLREKKFAGAKDYQNKALELAGQVAEATGDDRDAVQVTVIYENLGDVCAENDELAEAGKYYTLCLERAEQYAATGQGTWPRWYLSTCLDHLGDLGRWEKDLDGALEYYRRALELRQQLMTEAKTEGETATFQDGLCTSYANMGITFLAGGRYAEAREYYRKNMEVDLREKEACQKRIEEEPPSESSESSVHIWRKALAGDYLKLGDISRDMEELSDAAEYYQKAAGELEEVLAEGDSPELRQKLAVCRDRLAGAYKMQGNFREAREYYRKTIGIRKKLLERDVTRQARLDLIFSYENLGNLCRDHDELDEAKECYAEMIERLKVLAENDGSGEDYRRSQAIGCYKLGNICERRGEFSEARSCYLEMLGLARQLAEETGTVRDKRDVAGCYKDLASLCRTEGRLGEAKEYYRELLEICEALVKESDEEDLWDDLATYSGRMGELCEDKAEPDEAEKHYRRALEICGQLMRERDNDSARDNYALSCFRAGKIAGDAALIEQAYQIFARLAEKYPDKQRYTANRDEAKKLLDQMETEV